MSPVKSPKGPSARDTRKTDKTVVEKVEAEELPPGWTTEVKVRKAGSATKKDKYYKDPVTGYIFRSLKDVQRYLKTGEVGRRAIKPKNDNCVDTSNKEEHLHIKEKEETGESKEQMSESWRHKRPLEDGSNGCKTRSRSSETDRSELPHRASKRLAGINIDASLPAPSSPEPKTRQAIQVAKGAVDASQPLQSPPEPKTRQATRLAGVTVDASLPSPSPPVPKASLATQQAGVAVDESLLSSPPEPKTHQATQLVGAAVDASLPLTPEPKTRKATRLASIKVETPPPPPSTLDPKTRAPTQLAEATVDASLPLSPPEPKTRQATRQSGIKIDSAPDIRTSRQATRQARTKIDAPVPSTSPPAPKIHQEAQQAGIKIDSPSPSPQVSITCQPTQLAEVETVASPLLLPEPKTRHAKRASAIRDTGSPEPKTRRATRQSGIMISPPLQSLPETRSSRPASTRQVIDKKAEVEKITDKHSENTDMYENPNDKQETLVIIPSVNQESHQQVKMDKFKADEKPKQHNILPPATSKEDYKEIEMGPATLPPPKVQAPVTAVSPVNLGKQELPVFNPTVSNPVPQEGFGDDNMKPESSMSFSMNDLWTDPCIEFAVKTLTGAIPFADLNKVDNFPPSPLEVPLEELWTDPCIEFAVKTLTGAIPIGENDYLQHRPTSSSNSRAQHDFSLPDMGMTFCQTEILSKHYETGQSKQQDSVVPTLGNGGLQNSGNIVNRSNGQCSRSRFFQ